MSDIDNDNDDYEEEDYNYEYDRDEEEQEEQEEDERDQDERDEEEEIYLSYYNANSNNDEYEEQDQNYPEVDDEGDGNVGTNNPYYNNLYDVFNIHTSNEQVFNAMASNDSEIARHYSNLGTIVCPVCSERIHISQITTHMVYLHSSFYVSLSMLMNPDINFQNMVNTFNGSYYTSSTYNTIQNLMYSEDDNNNTSYEDLLNLCEYIGYHKPGIKDVDNAAPILEDMERVAFVCEEDTCRICLEGLQDVQPIRKIKACGHLFCSECIVQWFKENKTCPLCNIDCSPTENKTTQTEEVQNVSSLDDVD